jgi:hypothetical protein
MSHDTRLDWESRPKRDAAPTGQYSHATDMEAIASAPPFTCGGCGWGCWQDREPVHCIKCGGTTFLRPAAVPVQAAAGTPREALLEKMSRIAGELSAVEGEIRAGEHTKGWATAIRRVRQSRQRLQMGRNALAGMNEPVTAVRPCKGGAGQ